VIDKGNETSYMRLELPTEVSSADGNVRAPPAVTDRVHIFQQSTCQIPNPVHS